MLNVLGYIWAVLMTIVFIKILRLKRRLREESSK